MDSDLARLITQEERDRVMAPIETAATLPSQAYTSEAWFQLETERVFKAHWMAVHFACRLPNVGDVLPFEFLGMPLFAVRDGSGTLRVFHNVCPYDGCPVVLEEAQERSSLTVFYHGWEYSLAGKLLRAPFWNGAPDCMPKDMGGLPVDLVEVPSAVRYGVLFVNMDGEAGEVDDWLGPWVTLVGQHFAIDLLTPARGADGAVLIEERTVQANWKTYQENASINILHEAFTHALYRQSPDVPRVDDGGAAAFTNHMEGAMVAFSHDRTKSGETYDAMNLPMAGHDPEKQPDVGYFSTLYPNINVPLLDAMVKVNIVIPLSPSETRLLHLRFYRPEALACEQFQEEEQALQRLFDVVHREDQIAIEAVQRGRRSPVFSQHYYAPFWDALHHRFNQLVMVDMEKTRR